MSGRLHDGDAASPAQPDLRAYIVYDEVPAGCIPHIVRENTCPLLRQGETIVVDTGDREIAPGDLFLIEYGRGTTSGPSRKLIEFKQLTLCVGMGGEAPTDQPCWMGYLYSEIVPLTRGLPRQPVRMMDGPCKVSSTAYFDDRLIGRVVGILEASFVEPMRRAA